MTYKDIDTPNWRNDSGLSSTVSYKKKFAWIKTKCSDGSTIWFKTYYRKYLIWSTGDIIRSSYDDGYNHTDFIENVTESEYLVRLLADNL